MLKFLFSYGIIIIINIIVLGLAYAAPIDNIRYSSAADKVRIVLDSKAPIQYSLNRKDKELLINLPQGAGKEIKPGIKDIAIDREELQLKEDSSGYLLVKLTGNYQHKIFTLANPHRLVIDILKNERYVAGKDKTGKDVKTVKAVSAEKIDKSFDQAMRSIEKSFVRADVLLSAFAQEDGYRVLQDGCAVIDFGAQTTTLSIYKGSEYLAHKVVPQGGYNITTLLSQQGISFNSAEKLKRNYGYASADYVEKNLHIRLKATEEIGGELQITSVEIADLIESKLKEILVPILEQIDKYKDRIKTLYITGGASMLCGLDAYMQSLTGINPLYGAHDALVGRDTEEQYFSPRYSSLVGTLLLGASYRDTHKGELVKPPKLVDKFKVAAITLFSNE